MCRHGVVGLPRYTTGVPLVCVCVCANPHKYLYRVSFASLCVYVGGWVCTMCFVTFFVYLAAVAVVTPCHTHSALQL